MKNRSDPIGHLPVNEQAARDAAAGPPVGGTPKSSHEWPGPPKPSTRYQGDGSRRNQNIRFHCDTCPHVSTAIHELIQHVIEMHRRGPHDNERTPI